MAPRAGGRAGFAAIARGVGFLCLWLVIFGTRLPDLWVGMAAAAAATWTSLRLLPPSPARLRSGALARLVVRFFAQSVVAGVDVARRALHPALPLRPGFVRWSTRLARGLERDAFCAMASLLPGTLPAGSDRGALRVHCLDVGQDVAAQMAEEEAAFLAVTGGGRDDG